jgi:hypothetical protein
LLDTRNGSPSVAPRSVHRIIDRNEIGTLSNRVVQAGDRRSARIFHSRLNLCSAGTTVN